MLRAQSLCSFCVFISESTACSSVRKLGLHQIQKLRVGNCFRDAFNKRTEEYETDYFNGVKL
jgi:hypothetical protein